jgi:hypothetical protein
MLFSDCSAAVLAAHRGLENQCLSEQTLEHPRTSIGRSWSGTLSGTQSLKTRGCDGGYIWPRVHTHPCDGGAIRRGVLVRGEASPIQEPLATDQNYSR